MPPKIPKQLESVSLAALGDEQEIENNVLTSLQLPSQITKNSKLASSRIHKSSFAGSSFEKVAWFDILAEGSDFANASFSESTIQRVQLKASRLSGLKCNGCVLKDIEITDCKADLSEFRFSTLTNVIFRDCNLTGADFQNAKLKNVWFKKCVIDGIQFSAVHLENVDFRSSTLSNISGLSSMRGAIVDSMQLLSLAPALAAALGLQVKED